MNTQSNTLFNQAVAERWNHETDWLWLVTKVQTVEQQAACLERALYINPDNQDTRQRLDVLQQQMSYEQKQCVQQLTAHAMKA